MRPDEKEVTEPTTTDRVHENMMFMSDEQLEAELIITFTKYFNVKEPEL